jgi:DNA-binding MarR family transcriptional regulator
MVLIISTADNQSQRYSFSMSDPVELEVHRRLGYLLKHAFLGLEGLNDGALAPIGLSARELSVLLAVTELGSASQQEVAHALGVDRTTMVTFVDLLEEKGLVERQPDPSDRRRNVIEVTAAGKQAVERGRRASDQAEAALLAPLSEADQKRFRTALAAIAEVTRPLP